MNKQDYSKEDYSKEDHSKEDYSKQDYSKESLLKVSEEEKGPAPFVFLPKNVHLPAHDGQFALRKPRQSRRLCQAGALRQVTATWRLLIG